MGVFYARIEAKHDWPNDSVKVHGVRDGGVLSTTFKENITIVWMYLARLSGDWTV